MKPLEPTPDRVEVPHQVDGEINLRGWLTRILATCRLTSGDRLFSIVCGFALLALITVYWWRMSDYGRSDVEIKRQVTRSYDFRLDMNHATWVEWMQLEGIGEKLARSIVNDRVEQGPFRSVDELTRVRGIGPKTLERVRPYLAIPELSDRVVIGQTSSAREVAP